MLKLYFDQVITRQSCYVSFLTLEKFCSITTGILKNMILKCLNLSSENIPPILC